MPPFPPPDRLRPSGAVDNFGACGKVQYSGNGGAGSNTRSPKGAWHDRDSALLLPAPPNSLAPFRTHAPSLSDSQIPPPPRGLSGALHGRISRLTRPRIAPGPTLGPSCHAQVMDRLRERINLLGHWIAPFAASPIRALAPQFPTGTHRPTPTLSRNH